MVDVEHTFSQNRVFLAYGTETPTAGYTLLNAGFGFELMNKKGTTLLNLILSGRNLANTIYQSHLSRLKYAPENYATGTSGIFNMGRNLSVKIIMPVHFR